jgi:hypothetical protein
MSLEKLTFQVYNDAKFKNIAEGNNYTVMINPSSFKRVLNIAYDQKQASGSKGTKGPLKCFQPETWSFDFIIDGTGIVTYDPYIDGKSKNTLLVNNDHLFVTKEIEHLQKTIYSVKENSKRPPFVEISYCGNLFHGVLTSLNIDYTLFYPEGLPVRAKISCSFKSIDDTVKRVEPNDKIREKASGKPVEISFKTYRDHEHYLEIAKDNETDSVFQVIKP